VITAEHPEISIIIPAYNEEKRLPPFLDGLLVFALGSERRYEIIVVDDGSRDGTFNLGRRASRKHKGLSVVRLKRNRGKGYAVKRGFFKAKAPIWVFMDADGAFLPREVEHNLHYFQEGYDVVIGSRAIVSLRKLPWHLRWRKLLGAVFNVFVRVLLGVPFLDTQCGFKMFRARVVRPVFRELNIRRFGFDMELMFLIHRRGIKTKEAAVSWEHIKGSKVNFLWDAISMFINILQVRQRYMSQKTVKDKT